MSQHHSFHCCALCSKRFRRREHLHRHFSSHSDLRPYCCMFCPATFQRSDVLKRHMQTCDHRRTSGTVASSSKRRSCDFCASQKKACDLGHPCGNCSRKTKPCVYASHVTDTSSHAGHVKEHMQFSLPPGDGVQPVLDDHHGTDSTENQPERLDLEPTAPTITFDLLSPHWMDQQFEWDIEGLDFFHNAVSPSDVPNTILASSSFHFLHNFTSRTGLLDSFECGSIALRQQVLLDYDAGHDLSVNSTVCEKIPPASPPNMTKNTQIRQENASSTMRSLETRPAIDPLSAQAYSIVLRLKEAVLSKPRGSNIKIDWSTTLEQECIDFFAPIQMRRLLALYWAIWNPNINFIHRATFDPAEAEPNLLATMVLIAASISPDASHNERATVWYNCVEEVVLSDAIFCGDIQSAAQPSMQRRNVQALQAAYNVCLYQNWEGSDGSKRRVRRHRYSTIVSTVRDLDLKSAQHTEEDFIGPLHFDWMEFVVREERIRTFMWIYLLDQAFIIFNNLPPRMMINEMKMHMAWPEACFQAASSGECARQVRDWVLPHRSVHDLTLRDAVEQVCRGRMEQADHVRLADLGPLNLFAVVSAFHSLIFQCQNSFAGLTQITPITIGIDNWEVIWKFYAIGLASDSPHNMLGQHELNPKNAWSRIGFLQYCPEYWLLAKAMIIRLSHTGQSGQLQDTATALDPLLPEYDQTSMRQVNDLISGFQSVSI